MAEKNNAHPFFEPLIDTDFTGGSSIKQTFQSKPEIIVRYSPDDEVAYKTAVKAKKEYESLNAYGIHVARLDVVQGVEIYTITDRIHGENLDSALTHSDPVLINKFESLTIGLLNYLQDRSQPGSTFLADIYGPHQYVYGNSATQKSKEIYLVDLDFRVTDSRYSKTLWTEVWLKRLRYIAEDLVRVESILGQKLNTARDPFQKLLNGLPKEKFYMQGSRMIHKILRGKKITEEEWENGIYD